MDNKSGSANNANTEKTIMNAKDAINSNTVNATNALLNNTLLELQKSIEQSKAELEKARRDYESVDISAKPDLILVSLAQYAQKKLDRQKQLLAAIKALQM